MTKIMLTGIPTTQKEVKHGAELGLCPFCGAILNSLAGIQNADVYYEITLNGCSPGYEQNDMGNEGDMRITCPNCDNELSYDNEFITDVLKAAKKIEDRLGEWKRKRI
jgi:uncharacterized C2H2 Zn-finger protein